jgi:hypothetical protein
MQRWWPLRSKRNIMGSPWIVQCVSDDTVKEKAEVAYVHVGRERIKSLVKVVHLDYYAEANNNAEDIGADVYELIIAAKGELHGNTEALDCHDRDRANKGAYGDIYKWV